MSVLPSLPGHSADFGAPLTASAAKAAPRFSHIRFPKTSLSAKNCPASRSIFVLLLLTVLLLTALSPAAVRADDITLGAGAVVTENKVYFGTYNKSPVLWRVMGTGNAGSGMLLLSEYLLEEIQFNPDQTAANGNVWQDSIAQKWCRDFYSGSFTAAEKSSVIETSKTDPAYTVENGNKFGSFELKNEHVFFLSAQEVETYFPMDNKYSRIAYLIGSGGAFYWWLRSSDASTIDHKFVGDVSRDGGWITFTFIDYYIGARPAFNLDLASVLFSSEISENQYKLTLLDPDLQISLQSGKSAALTDGTLTIPYSITGKNAGNTTHVGLLVTDKDYSEEGAKILEYTRTEKSTDGTVSFPFSRDLDKWETDYHVYIIAEDVNSDYETNSATEPYEIRKSAVFWLSITAPTFDAVTYGYTELPEAKPITITNSGKNQASIASVSVSNNSFTIDQSYPFILAGGEKNENFRIRPVSGLEGGLHTAEITVRLYNGTSGNADISFLVNKAANPAYTISPVVYADGNTIDLTEYVRNAEGPLSFSADSSNLLGGSLTREGIFTSGSASGVASVEVQIEGNENFEAARRIMQIQIKQFDVEKVTFNAVTYGYTELPAAKPITITNKGKSDATITSVTVNSDSYTITQGDPSLPAGGTNETYTIQPVSGLECGQNNAVITVELSSGASGTANISFRVMQAANPAEIISPAEVYSGGNTVNLAEYVKGAEGPVSFSFSPSNQYNCREQGCSLTRGGKFTSGNSSGLASVEVNIEGNKNYNSKHALMQVQIILLEYLNVTQESIAFGQELPDPQYTLWGSTESVTIHYSGTLADGSAYDSDDPPSEVGSYTVTVTYAMGSDSAFRGSAEFTISKAAAPSLYDIPVSVLYTAREASAAITGMPEDAGTLSYEAGTASVTGNVSFSGASVGTDGKVTITYTNGAVGDTVTVPVTITSDNYADTTVNVVLTLINKEDAKVSISGSASLTKTWGESLTLSASAEKTGTNGSWTWTSSDQTVASVNENGEVTFLKTGKTEIKAEYSSDTTAGSAAVSLTIEPKDIKDAEVSVSGTYTYDKTEKQPAAADITVKLDGTTLASPEDYSIGYSDNINAGENTASVTVTGTGNYKGTASGTFSIGKKAVTVSGIAAQDKTYDGETTVTFDYGKVSFDGLEAGDKLTVTAEGAFESAGACAKDMYDPTTKTVSITGLTLGGDSIENYVLAESGQQDKTDARIFKAAAPNLADISASVIYTAGEASATVTGMPEDAGTLSYTIHRQSTPENIGKPDFNVDENGKVTITFTNGAEGDILRFLVFVGSDNYADAMAYVTFTLTAKEDAKVSISGSASLTKTWGESLTLSASAENTGTNGVWTWTSSDETVASVNENGAVTFLKTGRTEIKAEYSSDTTAGSAAVSLTIEPKDISQAEVTLSDTGFDYDEQEKSVTVTKVTLDGQELDPQTDYETGGDLKGTDPKTYSVTVSGMGNYTGNASADWKITKQSYTITWLDENGKEIDKTQVEYGEMPKHADPTKEADEEYTYTFSGWTPDLETVKGPAEYRAAFSAKGFAKVTKEPSAQTAENLVADGSPKDLLAEAGTAEGGTILYSVNGGDYSAELPQGTEAGDYTIRWYIKGDDDHNDLGSGDKPAGTLTVRISGKVTEVNAEFVFLKKDSSRKAPADIEEKTLKVTILLKNGENTVAQSDPVKLKLSGGLKNVSGKLTFGDSPDDLAPGKYTVAVQGLPKKLNDSFGEPGYKLTVKAEINDKDGEIMITIYLIFAGLEEPEAPIVRDLPEDEIGSYWIMEDGTKEYLLFHTYDICMAWLGSDELCRGPERCYHK